MCPLHEKIYREKHINGAHGGSGTSLKTENRTTHVVMSSPVIHIPTSLYVHVSKVAAIKCHAHAHPLYTPCIKIKLLVSENVDQRTLSRYLYRAIAGGDRLHDKLQDRGSDVANIQGSDNSVLAPRIIGSHTMLSSTLGAPCWRPLYPVAVLVGAWELAEPTPPRYMRPLHLFCDVTPCVQLVIHIGNSGSSCGVRFTEYVSFLSTPRQVCCSCDSMCICDY